MWAGLTSWQGGGRRDTGLGVQQVQCAWVFLACAGVGWHSSSWGAHASDPPSSGPSGTASSFRALEGDGLQLPSRLSSSAPESWVETRMKDSRGAGPEGGLAPSRPEWGSPLGVCRAQLPCSRAPWWVWLCCLCLPLRRRRALVPPGGQAGVPPISGTMNPCLQGPTAQAPPGVKIVLRFICTLDDKRENNTHTLSLPGPQRSLRSQGKVIKGRAWVQSEELLNGLASLRSPQLLPTGGALSMKRAEGHSWVTSRQYSAAHEAVLSSMGW